MFKKLLSVLFASVMSIAFLAACNFVQIDTAKYYNQVVASVSFVDKYEQTRSKDFTMKELLTGYNNYGEQFMQEGDKNVKSAVEQTLDTIIHRWILIERIKDEIQLSNADIQDVLREAYENVNKQLFELEKTIRKEWDREVTEEEGDKVVEPLRKSYEEYEQKFEIVIVDGVQKLVRIKKDNDKEEVLAGDFVQNITDPEVSKEAMKRFVKQLRLANEFEKGAKLTDKQLLDKEIERIYTVLEENKYITVFEEEFLKDTSVSVSEVVEYYNVMFKSQYADFVNDQRAYHEAMRQDSDSVYYHPVENEYMSVTHVLVKLSDKQNQQINDLNLLLKGNSIDQKTYDARLEIIKNQTVVKYNYTNEETEELGVSTKHINTVYNEILNSVNVYGSDVSERAKAFNEFIYKYNDDEGIMNKDFGYTVNLTNNGGQDVMIKEFTEAARDLNENGKVGDISNLVFAEYDQGKYGFHIIMNLGVHKNQIINHKGASATWQALFNQKLQPSSNKTMFNQIYDTLKLDQDLAQKRLNSLVLETNESQIIKIYENRIQKLWK